MLEHEFSEGELNTRLAMLAESPPGDDGVDELNPRPPMEEDPLLDELFASDVEGESTKPRVKPPTFDVLKVPTGFDDVTVYSPTSAESGDVPPGIGEDVGPVEPQDVGAARHARRESASARTPALDEIRDVPPGCSLRKYESKTDGPPFWVATLPIGMSDSKGHHTRRRAFRTGLRSEAQAIAQCEAWLSIVTEGAAVPSDSGSKSSSSSSSSSKSSTSS